MSWDSGSSSSLKLTLPHSVSGRGTVPYCKCWEGGGKSKTLLGLTAASHLRKSLSNNRVTIVIKHHDLKQHGRKGFTSLPVPCNSSLSKAERSGPQTGQELGGSSWCTCHGRVLLNLFNLLSYWTQDDQPRKCPMGLLSPNLWRHFSIEAPSSLLILACIRLT